MLKTLHGKLSLCLLALLCVVGLLLVSLSTVMTRGYVREVNQHLNRGLASSMARSLSKARLLPADLKSDAHAQAQASAEISHLMVLNPDIEIYVLDQNGSIVAYSSAPGRVQRDHVTLEPLLRFGNGQAMLPILGDDPRHPNSQKTFSAARIPTQSSEDLQGFIYIVLGGQDYDSAADMVGSSYILRWGSGVALVSFALVFVLGLVFFFMLTRPLRALTQSVTAFKVEPVAVAPGLAREQGEVETVLMVPLESNKGELNRDQTNRGARDEIGRLREAYADMMRRLHEERAQRHEAQLHRQELVSNVSHDLRTPLAALRGYLETVLMKHDALAPAERERYLMIALKHTRRLEHLVSELFELAKLDSPATTSHVELFALPELVQDVVQGFQLVAQEKGVELVAPFADGFPLVRGDIALVERALENTLENALRYTPFGGVVRVMLRREGSELAVQISDTGEGIAPEDLPHIFDRSYRAAKHRPEPGEGAGLGLAITKRILELHGGRVAAQSVVGAGATLTLYWPLAAERDGKVTSA